MHGGTEDHVPVLAEEAVAWLAVRPEGVYVDCTAGAGGHSSLIAERLNTGSLLALDRDPLAVEKAAARLHSYPRAMVRQANYGQLMETLASLGLGPVDGVLIDAGCSSMQLNDAGRGFSFQEDGPLDMRMDPTSGISAAEYLTRVSETDLTETLKRYGDVGPARRIARAVIQRRMAKPLTRTSDLAEAVHEALSFVTGMPEEVRTVFQAVRIAVNEELRWLERGVREAITALKPGGRLVVIAFHSGEDRVVKDTLKEASRTQRELYPDGRVCAVIPARVRLLTAKPVTPAAAEMRKNRRSKSAKLRAAERLPEEGG